MWKALEMIRKTFLTFLDYIVLELTEAYFCQMLKVITLDVGGALQHM